MPGTALMFELVAFLATIAAIVAAFVGSAMAAGAVIGVIQARRDSREQPPR